MALWTIELSVTGRAIVSVTADDEDEALLKGAQYDPWDLDVEVTGTDVEAAYCEEAES